LSISHSSTQIFHTSPFDSPEPIVAFVSSLRQSPMRVRVYGPPAPSLQIAYLLSRCMRQRNARSARRGPGSDHSTFVSQSRVRRVSSANAVPITTAPTAARRKSLVDLHASLIQPTATRVFTAMRTRSDWRVALCSVDRNVRRATGDVVVRSGRVVRCEPRARVDADSMSRDSINR